MSKFVNLTPHRLRLLGVNLVLEPATEPVTLAQRLADEAVLDTGEHGLQSVAIETVAVTLPATMPDTYYIVTEAVAIAVALSQTWRKDVFYVPDRDVRQALPDGTVVTGFNRMLSDAEFRRQRSRSRTREAFDDHSDWSFDWHRRAW